MGGGTAVVGELELVGEDGVDGELGGHRGFFSAFFELFEVGEGAFVAFVELGRADPGVEVRFGEPVGDDEIGGFGVFVFEDVHAEEAGHSVNGAGAGAEETFEALGVVGFAVDAIDGDKTGGRGDGPGRGEIEFALRIHVIHAGHGDTLPKSM